MRCFIEIDKTLLAGLEQWARSEKRTPRQQVEWIVEQALQAVVGLEPTAAAPQWPAKNGLKEREAEYAASGK